MKKTSKQVVALLTTLGDVARKGGFSRDNKLYPLGEPSKNEETPKLIFLVTTDDTKRIKQNVIILLAQRDGFGNCKKVLKKISTQKDLESGIVKGIFKRFDLEYQDALDKTFEAIEIFLTQKRIPLPKEAYESTAVV